MSKNFRVEVHGVKDVVLALTKFKESVANRVLKGATTKAARPILKEAKAQAPKESGLLRKSLGVKVVVYPKTSVTIALIGVRKGFRQEVTARRKLSGRLLAETGKKRATAKRTMLRNPEKYLHLILLGRKPSRAKGKRVLASGGLIWGTSVAAAKPNPFLKRAFAAKANEARAALRGHIEAGIQKEAARLAKRGT
jgi:hypothetical protein